MSHERSNKLTEYEDYALRNNLQVFGLPEKVNETKRKLEKAVADEIFTEKLGVTITSMEQIPKVARPQEGRITPRLMAVQF